MEQGRIARTAFLIAVFAIALMLATPSFRMGGHELVSSPVGGASASAGDRILRMGWVNLVGDIQTLNPLLYTMGAEFMVIWPCYSMLLTRDVNNQLIGDLATSWSMSPDGKTWTFEIVQTAKFYDKNHPSDNHPLTVDDIIFTYWLVQNSTNNYLQFYFPEIPGTGGRLIQSMTKINDYKMTITLRAPYAPFLSALTGIPILPKYLWSGRPWNWNNFDTKAGIPPCVGSGPFYYNLNGLPQTNTVELVRSPTWFGTVEYGWQIKTNKLVLKSETIDSNIADYLSGAIDIICGPTNEQFTGSLPGPYGQKWTSSQGFVYEFNLNQLTVENRQRFKIGGPKDYNNQLLLDPTVKLALAMCVDKYAFVDQVLGGLGSYADSLIPPSSPWHYWYGLQPGEDPTREGRAPPGEEPVQFNPSAARTMLNAAGWAYDLQGRPATATTYPLCKAGGTDPLQFRFVSPNDAAEFIEGSMLIQQWARQAGIDLRYSAVNPNMMNTIWSTADYDTWLWDWWFTPTSEPSVDVMQVLTTEAIGSWSDVYWSNATYDALYYKSLSEMNPIERQKILDQMQRMAYEMLGCQLVAYADMLYAAQSVAPEYWQNWGDWHTYYPLTPDSGYPWVFMRIYPADNPAPRITSFQTYYETDTTTPVQFTASASDSATLEYRWNFGDGTKSSWSASPSVQHTYTKDGYYTATLMVREVGTLDGYISSMSATVKVIDLSNTAPHHLSFTVQPSDPDAGTVVYFNGTAVDDQGDPLTFSWSFGDGNTALGQRVTHQFTSGSGSYTVTMYVDDGHLGQQARPVSVSQLVVVAANSPPTISVPDYPNVQWKVNTLFSCAASDPNPRDKLKFTWEWGDGTKTVTYTNTAYHTYTQKLTFTLRVWVDDQTGLPGHNVSDTGLVTVKSSTNAAPVITAFSASSTSALCGQFVTFSVTATDANGDLLQVTFNFGDSTSYTTVQTTPNSTVTTRHAYAAAGFYAATVTVSDGQASPVTWPLPVVVVVSDTWTLSLVKGWNFITVPLVGQGYKASTLGLARGDMVARWNSATQSYDMTYIVGISPPSFDFDILPSTGYWVYSLAAKNLTLRGSLPASQDKYIDLPDTGGFAAVGLALVGVTVKASDLAAMFYGGNVLEIAEYNPVTGTYKVYFPAVPITDFTLTTGRAVWLLADASGTLSYEQ